ncbi:MAG TPA: extracellular solute-binding protein [Oligoflexus sp.]|uniref:extracellular solute-binding protein n=1 Tax=Oligoflexus sp. TaxID=1971216 RepID=UPI002D807485|nr:extracellular solute-binding protein [Oligoflexus sp.]HET9240516.1 extracellular solute-binding protein [Oligoflexus sp.]
MSRLKRVCFGWMLLLLLGVPAATAATDKVLQFWVVGNGIEDSLMYRELARNFEKESGYKVHVTPLSWGNFNQKYLTSMAAALPPDIGVANLGSPMEWGSLGGVVALDKEFPEEIAELKGRFFPGTLPQFTFNGHLYGLPTELVTAVLYYRKDVFERLNLVPPKTWSELQAAIRKLEVNRYHFHFGWTRGEQWALYYQTLPFGFAGVGQTPDGQPALDWLQPAYQKGVAHGLGLWHLHDAIGDGSTDRTIGRFLSDIPDQSLGMMVDGNWVASSIQKIAPEAEARWGVVPWPKADEGQAINVMGGTSYVIFQKSKHKAAAFAWLKYLNSLEAQQFMILERVQREGQAAAFNISPVKAVWDESQTEFWARPEFQDQRKIIDALRGILDTFQSFPYLKGKPDTDQIEARILDRMGTAINRRLTAEADLRGLTRWDYIKWMASEEGADKRNEMNRWISAQLSTEYAQQYPLALQRLNQETARYQNSYGDIVANLDAFEGRRNILDYLKWGALGSMILGLILVFSMPRLRAYRNSYAFIAVPCILSLVFVVVPMLTSLYLSFTEYHSILPLASAKWIGFQHYLSAIDLKDSENVLRSIGKTMIYVSVTVPAGILLALLFAALLNNDLIGQRFWRFLYFSPLITSAVSVSLIFTQLYRESSMGWLNAAFLKLGWITNPILFLKDPQTFLACVMALAIWHGLAFTILLFLAGLQQIPTQLYKAAEIDGAGWWQKFWHVSLPGIRPQLFFALIMGLIGSFQVFEQIYMLGGGSGYAGSKFGPNDAGRTMVPLIYDLGFEQFKMGRASAVAYILFLVILVFTMLQLRVLRQKTAD